MLCLDKKNKLSVLKYMTSWLSGSRICLMSPGKDETRRGFDPRRRSYFSRQKSCRSENPHYINGDSEKNRKTPDIVVKISEDRDLKKKGGRCSA